LRKRFCATGPAARNAIFNATNLCTVFGRICEGLPRCSVSSDLYTRPVIPEFELDLIVASRGAIKVTGGGFSDAEFGAVHLGALC
jgi:hypothetical protein